jgi:hypothetical protein
VTDISTLATGPYLAACALLGVAGVAKVRAPARAAGAARALRLPATNTSVRTLGVVECAAAVAGAAFGGAWAVLVGAGYAALAFVAFGLARRAPAVPCGCLGATDAPASLAHVCLNVACAVVSFVVAFGERPWSVVQDQPLAGVPFLVLSASCAWLAELSVEALPSLQAAIREGRT